MGILILILVVLTFGISIGLMLGFSRAMREAAKQIHGTRRPLIAKVLIGIACAGLLGAAATALYTWHFTRTAQQTPGTVIEMRKRIDRDSGSVTYAPTFRFNDAAGDEHTVASSFFSAPPEFRVGERVRVLYRADSPQSARIDSYWQVWGLPSLLGIISSIELPVGLAILLWPKITARFRRHPAAAPAG
jgi:hypothetical protein